MRAGFLDGKFRPTPGSFDVITMFNVLEHLPEPYPGRREGLSASASGRVLGARDLGFRSRLVRALARLTVADLRASHGALLLHPSHAEPPLRPRPVRDGQLPAFRQMDLAAIHGLSLLEYEKLARRRFAAYSGPFGARGSGASTCPIAWADLTVAIFRRSSSLALRPRDLRSPDEVFGQIFSTTPTRTRDN